MIWTILRLLFLNVTKMVDIYCSNLTDWSSGEIMKFVTEELEIYPRCAEQFIKAALWLKPQAGSRTHFDTFLWCWPWFCLKKKRIFIENCLSMRKRRWPSCYRSVFLYLILQNYIKMEADLENCEVIFKIWRRAAITLPSWWLLAC